jgi:hypothetical protein
VGGNTTRKAFQRGWTRQRCNHLTRSACYSSQQSRRGQEEKGGGEGKEHTYIQADEMMLEFRPAKLSVHIEELRHCGLEALGHNHGGRLHLEQPARGDIHTHTSNVVHVAMGDEQEVLRDGAGRAAADVEGDFERGKQDAGLLATDGDALNGEAGEVQGASGGAAEWGGRRRRGGGGRRGHGEREGGSQGGAGAMEEGGARLRGAGAAAGEARDPRVPE